MVKKTKIKETGNDYLNPNLNEKSFKIIEMLAKTISAKTGVSYDLLYSEAINKLSNINRNYVPDVGKSFNSYLKSCINGYMLNFVRNRSFAVPINRTHIDRYLKYLKYGNIQETADRLSLEPHDIEVAINKVQASRNFYQLHGNIKDEAPEEFHFSRWIISRLDDWEKHLLEDFFIEKLNNEQMKKNYGKNWKDKLDNIKIKLNRLRQT